jgi:hypothetical protein
MPLRTLQRKGKENFAMSDKKELMVQETKPLSVVEVKAQINLIQQVMQGVMKKETHYGTIAGCGDKPALFKAGAEKIMATFRLSADPQIENLSTPDVIHYIVRVRITDVTGRFLGTGVGECSSREEKYQWRFAVCKEEFDDTPEDQRRIKYKRTWNKNTRKYEITKQSQIKTNPADVANTILKMAKKRGLIDGVLTVTGASDIFAQDLDDLPEEVLASIHEEEQKPSMPQAKQPDQKTAQQQQQQQQTSSYDASNDTRPITPAQIGRLMKIAGNAGVSEETVNSYILVMYQYESKKDIQRKDYEAICKAIEEKKVTEEREVGQEG